MTNEKVIYKMFIENLENSKQEFLNQVHAEKSNNDKLKNTAEELKHSNGILNMENDIMAERLKELYKEIDEIAKRRATFKRTEAEF